MKASHITYRLGEPRNEFERRRLAIRERGLRRRAAKAHNHRPSRFNPKRCASCAGRM